MRSTFPALLALLCAGAPASAKDERALLAARLERCDLERIGPAGGRTVRVKVGALSGQADGTWVIHASRARGEKEWRAVMLRSLPALAWSSRAEQRELVLHHGRLTGRAVILRTKGRAEVEVSALSYTDAGPPFHFDWDSLRARVAGGEGRLFVRVRGWVDFEGQGRAEAAVCALVAAR